MKQLKLSLMIYGLVLIFLLYSLLQITQGIAALVKTNTIVRTTAIKTTIQTMHSQPARSERPFSPSFQ